MGCRNACVDVALRGRTQEIVTTELTGPGWWEYHQGMNKTTKSELEIKLTAAQVQMVMDWRDLDIQIAKLTAERDAIKGQLQDHVEKHGAQICTHRGKMIARMQEWHRNTIDSKRLKVEAPAVAAAYTKESSGASLKYVA